jgi:hypothetical protein
VHVERRRYVQAASGKAEEGRAPGLRVEPSGVPAEAPSTPSTRSAFVWWWTTQPVVAWASTRAAEDPAETPYWSVGEIAGWMR